MAFSLPPMMTTTWPMDSWLVDGADVLLLVLFIIDVAFGLRSITTDAAAFVGCRDISAIVFQDIVLLLSSRPERQGQVGIKNVLGLCYCCCCFTDAAAPGAWLLVVFASSSRRCFHHDFPFCQ